MEIWREINQATVVYFPLIDRGTLDFENTPPTFVAADCQFSIDKGAFANTGSTPVHEGNGLYSLDLLAAEVNGQNISITVIDSATKLWEDQAIIISTYGSASAEHAVNLNDAVRAGLTALPNAVAEAAGGLYTRGTGAGQINQDANGRVDTSVANMAANVLTAAAIAAAAFTEPKFATAFLTAAKFAAGAIDANALATDAVNEIARAVGLQKNTATNDITFLMVDDTDHITAKTGLSPSGERSIDGGIFAAITGSVAEISDGIYQFDASAADMNGDKIMFRFFAATADDVFIPIKTVA